MSKGISRPWNKGKNFYNLTKKELQKLYCHNKMTGKDIAEDVRCSPSTVYNWIKKYNLSKNSRKDYIPKYGKSTIPKKKLKKLYWEKEKTTREIGDQLGVSGSCVLYWMRKYGIPRREVGLIPIDIKKDTLIDLYWEKCLNTSQIAKKFKVSKSTIQVHMEKLGIQRRTTSEAQKGKKVTSKTKKRISRKLKQLHRDGKIQIWNEGKNWYKTKCKLTPSPELSYLLGVAYGDAKVTKYKANSQFAFSLEVKDKEFAEKFREYALLIIDKKEAEGVWQSKRGYYGFSVYSRQLYDYLTNPLQEHKKVIELFPIQFIRGFFDSEGSVYGYSISMCNTNQEVIEYVKQVLETIGIKTHLHSYNREDRDCKTIYHLNIIGDSRQIFTEKVNTVIKRKQKRLDRYE